MSKKPPQIGQKAWAPKAASPSQQQPGSATPAASPVAATPSASPVATPSAGAVSPFVPSLPPVSQLQPGTVLRVTSALAPSAPFEGVLVVYDAPAGLLLVERCYDFADERNEHNRESNGAAAGTGKKDYALLNVQHVRVEVATEAPANSKPRVLPALHKPSLDAKVAAGLHARAEERACIGVGVSAEGQKLFDAIRKTTPCVWKGDSFVVLDCVRVAPPYNVAACSIVTPQNNGAQQQAPNSPPGRKSGQQQQAENMLMRVRKLVDEISTKLKLHQPPTQQ